jgi:hypothetical protein
MNDYDFGSNFDLGSFDDIAAIDFGNLDLGGFEDMDLGGLDLGGFEDVDFGGLDLSGLEGMDFDSIDLGNMDLGGLEGLDLSGLEGMDFDSIDLGDLSGGSTRSLFGGGGGDSNFDLAGGSGSDRFELTRGGLRADGLGLNPTGRGQLSIRDPETGATGLTAEGFTSIQDLLGSGTAEEIGRYTPGSADYSFRSGLDTADGQGLSTDATRGMGLDFMGGGQGISQYKPAEFGGSILEDLIGRMDPKYTDSIQDYLNNEIFGGKGLTPFKGTGGTLSQAGFLNQSSAANPLGAQYALGDPKSFINRPSVTGQQAAVSPGRTVIDNKNGTFNVVTEKDGKVITQKVDDKGKVIDTKTTDTKKTDTTKTATTPTTTQQSGLNSLLPLLLALLAMNRGGGGGGGGQGAVIPGLTATQKQTPYAQQQRAPGYRPGQGGISYFDQTQYTPKMAAGGGIPGLLYGPGDGVSDSIPAVIDGGMAGGGQPAEVARGEYIIDARTVAALGNGSTDAGAERLDKMRTNILHDDRKAGVGKDSKAYRHLLA